MGNLKYKGYSGSVEFSPEDNCFFGKVQGLKALLFLMKVLRSMKSAGILRRLSIAILKAVSAEALNLRNPIAAILC